MCLGDNLKKQLVENTVKLCEENGIEINVETRLERAEQLLTRVSNTSFFEYALSEQLCFQIKQFLKGE